VFLLSVSSSVSLPVPAYTLIFANGDLNSGAAVRAVLDKYANTESRHAIAVDGGLRHTVLLGIVPDAVIGDMDSADHVQLAYAERSGAEILRYKAEKDETDLELGLQLAAERGGNPVRILGASGSRLDQVISNIYLLSLPELRNRDVRIVSGEQTSWLAYPGETIIDGMPGDTVSLIPLAGDATGIVTHDLRYPLRGESLSVGPARGVSNVMLSHRASVTLASGLLLIIHTIGRA
jgi:thiamine pyrophosphokinase